MCYVLLCEWINKICNGNKNIFVTKIFQAKNENNQSTRKNENII